MRLFDLKRVHQGNHVGGDGFGRILIEGRGVRIAGAPVIEGDAAVAFRKMFDLVSPSGQQSDQPRNEYKGRPGAGLFHVQGNLADVNSGHGRPAFSDMLA